MATSLQLYTVTGISALALFVLIRLYSRYYKLSHIPGPFLAALTDHWRGHYQSAGGYPVIALDLHKKYGPIVRVGPNTVHVSDATAVSTIYTNHGEFWKADTYGSLRVPTAQGPSIGSVIDLQDETQNTLLKRGVGSAFTTKAVLAYENDVDTTARELIQVIKGHPTFDLFPRLQSFQLDFLTKIAFSQSYGHLKERRDVWGVTGPTRQCIHHFARWQALPTLEYYLYRHPLWRHLCKIPESSTWVLEALSLFNARLSLSKDLPHPINASTDLLQKYVDASKKYLDIKPATLAMMTISTISAGFDTTALTSTSVLFYLLTHPRVLAKLEKELPSSSPDIPSWESVNKLPYLDAVLKESMRCNSFLPVALERIVPLAGATTCDLLLAPGTIVGSIAHMVHRDPHVFGPDVETFRPERWLDASPEQRLAMERGSLGFGSGKRGCLGRHIAELEIKKVVPALVRAFDMALEDETTRLESSDVGNFPGRIMVRFEAKKGVE